ncbi:hypothetical protein CLF_106668 [Clonorchis sinensis]|uniref:Uncharacterized protein n=1 Tax=Clonorchis sinensis TaxID=79923 RepID=G7YFH1_CLOSI|nr:hypothetical protein CLF_106668 [Clonorchis sinensis]
MLAIRSNRLSRFLLQRSPDRCTHRDLGNACDKSSATTSNMSPTVLQATPELTITLHASATESMVPVAESKEQQSPELSVLDSVHKDEVVEQAKEQTSCRDSAAVTPETVEISRKRVVLASQDNVRIVEGCPPQCEAAVNPLAPSNDDLATADHPETCDQVRFPTLPEMAEHDEDDDFDLEDRPLTVDVSLALDTTPEDRNAGKEKATPATAPSVPVVSSSSGVVNIAPLLPQPPTLQPCPAVSKQLRRFQTPNLSGRSAQQTMRAGGAATSVREYADRSANKLLFCIL